MLVGAPRDSIIVRTITEMNEFLKYRTLAVRPEIAAEAARKLLVEEAPTCTFEEFSNWAHLRIEPFLDFMNFAYPQANGAGEEDPWQRRHQFPGMATAAHVALAITLAETAAGCQARYEAEKKKEREHSERLKGELLKMAVTLRKLTDSNLSD